MNRRAKTFPPDTWPEFGTLPLLERLLPRSPGLLLAILVPVIFLISYGVMLFLHRVPVISKEVDILLDAGLMIVLLYPFLVLLVKRPFLSQVRAREFTAEALSESEFRMQMILENNPYFIAVRDGAGVVHLASRVYAEFYGTSADRMIDAPLSRLHNAAGLDEAELEKSLAADRRVIESGRGCFGLERLTGSDGAVRWYRVARLPVTMPSGARCVLAFSGEITRRIRAEEDQRRVSADLERAVAERTAALEKTNRELTETIAAHRKTEADLIASRAQLRDLSARLRSALEEERTRIAREIHDELGQSLTALKFDLADAGRQAVAAREAESGKTEAMIRCVDSILATVKRLSRELRPGVLDDLGLAAAIEWQAREFQERMKIPCEAVVIPEDLTVDPERSTAIFRIFQETLTNIARHSGATRVEAILESRDGDLSLEVRDNGRGITRDEITGSKSLGLIGIRERVRYWGGEVRFEGSPGGGTVVVVTLPRWDEGGLDAQHPAGG